MSSLPTPNWIINTDTTITKNNDFITLKEGTFARPLALEYVPDYVKESPSHKNFDSQREVYCYTSIGIVPIKLDRLSKI